MNKYDCVRAHTWDMDATKDSRVSSGFWYVTKTSISEDKRARINHLQNTNMSGFKLKGPSFATVKSKAATLPFPLKVLAKPICSVVVDSLKSQYESGINF